MNNSNRAASRRACWLAAACLVLAFQLSSTVQALQNNESPSSALQQDTHSASPAASAQPGLVSMGSESSSALESSASLAGDDLMAAESSQAPDSVPAEHKSFTNAVRQVSRLTNHIFRALNSLRPPFSTKLLINSIHASRMSNRCRPRWHRSQSTRLHSSSNRRPPSNNSNLRKCSRSTRSIWP